MSEIDDFLNSEGTKLSLEYFNMTEIREILSSTKCRVKELDFSDVDLSNSELLVICELVKSSKTVEILDLRNCSIDDGKLQKILELLDGGKDSIYLKLSNNLITSKGANTLSCFLGAGMQIAGLDLSGNAIGDDGAMDIATVLHNNSCLKEVRLSDCKISDKGGDSLAESMLDNTSLSQLDLSCNNIGLHCAVSFSRVSACNRGLKNLQLGNNPIGVIAARGILRKDGLASEHLSNFKTPVILQSPSKPRLGIKARRRIKSNQVAPTHKSFRASGELSKKEIKKSMQVALANIYWNYTNYISTGLNNLVPLHVFKVIYAYANRRGEQDANTLGADSVKSAIDAIAYVTDFVVKLHIELEDELLAASYPFELVVSLSYAFCVPDRVKELFKAACEAQGKAEIDELKDVARHEISRCDSTGREQEMPEDGAFIIGAGRIKLQRSDNDEELARHPLLGEDASRSDGAEVTEVAPGEPHGDIVVPSGRQCCFLL